MTTNAFDSAIRQVATASISGYQRYISPHKGFSCAHRLLYGSESCSQFVKRTISQYGLIDGIKASRRRFQACKAANQILRAKLYQVQSSEPESEEDAETSKKRKPNPSVTPINDTDCLLCGDCFNASTECGSGISDLVTFDCASCELPDCGSALHCGSGLDCSGLDCASGFDCSGLDCSGLDCGSCG